jgi:hypothetical protein
VTYIGKKQPIRIKGWGQVNIAVEDSVKVLRNVNIFPPYDLLLPPNDLEQPSTASNSIDKAKVPRI